MDHITFLVAVVIVTAPAFDFTNGFHDTADAMATSIPTGALRPRTAVLISGVLNIAGAFLSTEVAKTISGESSTTPWSPRHDLRGAGRRAAVEPRDWLLGLPSRRC
ncbi:inorganic phosphate transporter [Streptomyces sp. MI02-7b]|nr:inorganic phosphate transporter [Streptomyces sp. MI02-7b]MDX3073404.1 inorganic phosphate transporter [Streptomyces sp. MI02-7b]